MVHTHKKAASLDYVRLFYLISIEVKCMRRYVILSGTFCRTGRCQRKCFVAWHFFPFFFSFLCFVSVLSQPPPSLSLSVLSLSLISDPFFMHYSITLSPIYSALLLSIFKKTHFLSPFSSSLSFLALFWCTVTFLSAFLLNLLLSLYLSYGHVTSPPTKDFSSTYLCVRSCFLYLSVKTAVSAFPSNWLFKVCRAHLVSVLPIVLTV